MAGSLGPKGREVAQGISRSVWQRGSETPPSSPQVEAGGGGGPEGLCECEDWLSLPVFKAQGWCGFCVLFLPVASVSVKSVLGYK